MKDSKKDQNPGEMNDADKNRARHLDFMAQMFSHNLRAPVAGLKMLLPLLDKTEGEEQNEVIEHIKEASESLSEVINDFSLIMMDYRHMNEEPQDILLRDVVNGVKSDLDGMISESNATVETDLEVPNVNYQLDLLRIVLTELITNALSFCPATRSPEILIRSFTENGKVIISVQDNGLGIDLNEHSEDLFKMYRSLQSTTSDAPHWGKGLFRVKNIVETSGGRLWVESQHGIGSTFFVEL